MSCLTMRLGTLLLQVSREGLLQRLFERSGGRRATSSHVTYGGNTTGLLVPSRRLRPEVGTALCHMDVRYQGKPIHGCCTDLFP